MKKEVTYEGKPDVWYGEVITQRKHKWEGLAIYIPNSRDQSEFSSSNRNTKPQLKSTETPILTITQSINHSLLNPKQ